MTGVYFDSGVLLKLYTNEPDSQRVQDFIFHRKALLQITHLHLAEFSSALNLKVFRGECGMDKSQSALELINKDLKAGILREIELDWAQAWGICRKLSSQHSHETGTRTLDSLHVACAELLGMREFVSTDKRQALLAERLGLRVVNPLR